MATVLPLLGLRAFVEVGRYGSIKAAAHHMGVTSGAVSQQIKLLEARIGVALLIRERYGVRLTKTGVNAHPTLLHAFEQIGVGLEMLQTVSAQRALTISVMPSFAATWLVPRLGHFAKRHPDIEIRVEASSSLVDLRRDRVDIAIRHGLGDYPGLAVIRLYAPVLLPVGSPALLAKGPPISQPIDCLAYPLLHDSARADWPLWLKAFGVVSDARATQGTSLDDDYLVIRAAEAGHGVALVRDVHALDEIAAGRLMLALDKPWPTRFAYYMVTLPNAGRRREVREFTDWIIEQMKQP
jgi:LysR family transcriptional regulator, glycine cleavage system transcriptional activator